jgi:hypothetical protein
VYGRVGRRVLTLAFVGIMGQGHEAPVLFNRMVAGLTPPWRVQSAHAHKATLPI